MTKDIDILVRGGKVYDGTGGAPVLADIAIAGGQIASVAEAKDRDEAGAEVVIDAAGLSVAPGFIDVHSHSEFTLFADGRGEGKAFQGVTTEINGNCGLSAAPLYGAAKEQRESDLQELGIKERWETFREYFALFEKRGLAINYATLAGHGNIRSSVMGYEDRKPSRSEMERMRSLLRDAVSEGAIGLSTGLIYPPGVYADTKEITELARTAKDLIYATHMRSEGDALTEALEEAVKIGRDSGIRVQISHIKTGGKANWGKIERAVSIIESTQKEGLRVACDRYPYIAACTDLDAVLPSWTYAGGAEEEMRKLNDASVRSQIRNEFLSAGRTDDYWSSITISSLQSEANRWMEGKSFLSVANKVGKDPVDFLFDILLEEKLRIGAIYHSMNEDNLLRFLSLAYVMIGSDSSARSMDGPTRQGRPHPRTFGTFPRFLGRYARDKRLMGLSGAIHKMTMLPAKTFGLKERGILRPGFIADLIIFDENRIIDRATYEEPFQKPDGIPYVLVNGSPVVWEGNATGKMAGKILRHGK
ncbi:MAG TPA: D-aminoacylase [Thermodesulfovibrionales bacterium]|nr:D-aminoacylase [Thermodesulfovibrionales bacterium]